MQLPMAKQKPGMSAGFWEEHLWSESEFVFTPQGDACRPGYAPLHKATCSREADL